MPPLFLLLTLFSPAPSTALLGYDCGGQHLNITSISLLDAGECDLDIKTTNYTDTYIQLLQISDYNYAEIIQCKMEITRTIYYCGMHSHISAVHNGQISYLKQISGEHCQDMHRSKTTIVGHDNMVDGLQINRTTTQGLTLAGKINTDGTCKGQPYNDPYGNWDDVIVQAVVKVTLKSGYVPVHLNSGRVILKSGTICHLADGHCIDSDDGDTYWQPVPASSCDFHQYDVLYEGTARKIRDHSDGTPNPTVYSLNTQDVTFALMSTRETQFCGYTLHRTEHPRLLIVETRRGNEVKKRTSIAVDNLDIFAYVNSKFIYVEKHLRTQMTSLYNNVMKQRCELEKEVIKNTLSFATLQPDEFAYRLMKGPGHMAVTAGEATHVIQCIPVDVMVRRTKDCYLELPVTARNVSLFITPKSRILTKIGTQRECSHELPTLYRIEDTWIQLLPEPHILQVPPQQLKPMVRMSWKYLTPGSLATSGIYSQEDINKLRDHIMFPAEKPAVLNSIARGLTGYRNGAHTASIQNLLDEESINKIAQNAASKLWGGFITFGSATAGVLGIFIIIRIIKVIIDTAIHGYALHTVYGCSLHLLGALWSSITHLLLHLAHGPAKRTTKNQPASDEDFKDAEETKNLYATPINPENPNTFIVKLPTTDYKKLSMRLSELEQIPPNQSGVCSSNRGEV